MQLVSNPWVVPIRQLRKVENTHPLLRNPFLGYLPSLSMMRLVQCLKQFGPGRLKTPHHYFACSLEEFVAKSQILTAVVFKHPLLEEKSGDWRDGSRGIMPKVWRKEPRPPEGIAGGQGIGCNRTMLENPSLKCNSSALNQVKAICRSARAENDVAFPELHERCAIGQKFDMMGAHSGEEWMRGDAH